MKAIPLDLLALVHGGALSVGRRQISSEMFDDGSSLVTSMQDGVPTYHAIPAFENTVRQGQLGDCFAVASINAIAATPEGRAHLDSLVKEVGPNQYEVKLRDPYESIRDPNAAPMTVQVSLPENGAGPHLIGDPKYQAIERAVGTLHSAGNENDPVNAINNGGYRDMVMRELGLQNVSRGYGFEGAQPPPGVVSTAGTYHDDMRASEWASLQWRNSRESSMGATPTWSSAAGTTTSPIATSSTSRTRVEGPAPSPSPSTATS